MEAEEILIVGGGPAGASAALALAEQGRRVHVLDAGGSGIGLPPEGSHAGLRFGDSGQWRWQLGSRFEALAGGTMASPKLRVPGFMGIFDGYAQANRIRTDGKFQLVGALAEGGLSNAWGCGVGRFDASELGALGDDADALGRSYDRAARRMGLSGASEDSLSSYFGLDSVSDPPLPLDPLHARLWSRRNKLATEDGIHLGRARVAVLSRSRPARSACDLRGMCLWGCRAGATWSAAADLQALRLMPGARVTPNALVRKLRRDGDAWLVHVGTGSQETCYRARTVLLAAGTIASTRLALDAMSSPPASVRLLSNPMAAFLLTLPGQIGKGYSPAFGLAQLSYMLENVAGNEPASGNLFSTSGIPVSEFLPHLPISRRAGLPLLRGLLPATVVGNAFLPGSLSRHSASLADNGELTIRTETSDELSRAYQATGERLRRAFRRMGAWMLPGSFIPGAPGADLHYAGTLPINRNPRAHECHLSGGISGLPGVYAIDGASLPVLPAKAHTLTIIANADRIARALPLPTTA